MPETTTPSGVEHVFSHAPTAMEAEIAALKAQIRQLSLILDSAADYAIIRFDNAGEITRLNAGASRIIGYIAEEVTGRSRDIVFTSEDRASGRFATELCQALENGRAVNGRWNVRRDGSQLWTCGLMMPMLVETASRKVSSTSTGTGPRPGSKPSGASF